MKKKIILFLLLVSAGFITTHAQTTSNYNAELVSLLPQTPQAAAFARYGEYPVSLATGVPQIDIPFYTIEHRDIRIPISISYHASGIKVEDIATPVGLGWALNTGGVITRTTYGAVDALGYTNNRVKSVEHVRQLMQDKNADVDRTWRQYGRNRDYDTESDRYVYNFNGKTGVFRYNSSNNEITTIPYAPLKIETTSNGFKIKDTDGLIYHFEGKETRHVSGYDIYVVAWYVTKIESQLTAATVNYTYKIGTTYFESAMSNVQREGTEYWKENVMGVPSVRSGPKRETNNHITTIIYTPLLVDEIAWENNKIKFEYQTDRLDKYKDRLTTIKVSGGSNVVKTMVFNNNNYWGSSAKNYRMRLNSVDIKGSSTVAAGEKYQFKYNTTPLPDYSRILMLENQFRCCEDYWGYYNGLFQKLNNFVPANYAMYDGTDREPNATYMQACILKEIIYPTGGITAFEYEPNQASSAYDYNYAETIVGGLRIKSMVSRTNGEEVRKTYEYEGTVNQMISADMFQYRQYRIYSFKEVKSILAFPYFPEWEIVTSSPLYSITSWAGNPVFYSTITEYKGSKEQNSGKIVSKYTTNLRDQWAFPDYEAEFNNQNGYRFWHPFYNYDQGLLEPLLTSEEVYEYANACYTLKKETRNTYLTVDKGQITCGVRLSFRDEWAYHDGGDYGNSFFPYNSIDDFFAAMHYCDLIAYRYFHLLSTTQTIEYNTNGNITTTTSHSYDPSHRVLTPIKTTVVNSNGLNVEESVTHPFHMTTDPYTEMVQKNILSPVIRKTRVSNGSSLDIGYNYSKQGARYLISHIQSGTNGTLDSRITYQTYDAYSNPVYLSKDNATYIVYLWSYNGQYPIAEIRNVSYTDVNSVMYSVFGVSSIEALAQLATPNETKLKDGSLQKALPNALVTTCTYKPLVGMLSVTDPACLTTHYEYDTMGRLVFVRDTDGKPARQYMYNFINQ